MNDSQGHPGVSPRLVRMMEHIMSDWYYRVWRIAAAVVLGLWVWEGPSVRRFVAAAAIMGLLLILSLLSRRLDRHVLTQLKSSASRPPWSKSQKILVWVVFAVAIGIGLWMGVLSAWNEMPT